jgi:hypothetical protein
VYGVFHLLCYVSIVLLAYIQTYINIFHKQLLSMSSFYILFVVWVCPFLNLTLLCKSGLFPHDGNPWQPSIYLPGFSSTIHTYIILAFTRVSACVWVYIHVFLYYSLDTHVCLSLCMCWGTQNLRYLCMDTSEFPYPSSFSSLIS